MAVDCYRRGMTEPLPLFPKFSYQLYRGKSARGSWRGFRFPEDGDQLAVRLAFGDRDFEGITGLIPRPSDPRGGQGPGHAVRHLPVPDHRPIEQFTPDG